MLNTTGNITVNTFFTTANQALWNKEPVQINTFKWFSPILAFFIYLSLQVRHFQFYSRVLNGMYSRRTENELFQTWWLFGFGSIRMSCWSIDFFACLIDQTSRRTKRTNTTKKSAPAMRLAEKSSAFFFSWRRVKIAENSYIFAEFRNGFLTLSCARVWTVNFKLATLVSYSASFSSAPLIQHFIAFSMASFEASHTLRSPLQVRRSSKIISEGKASETSVSAGPLKNSSTRACTEAETRKSFTLTHAAPSLCGVWFSKRKGENESAAWVRLKDFIMFTYLRWGPSVKSISSVEVSFILISKVAFSWQFQISEIIEMSIRCLFRGLYQSGLANQVHENQVTWKVFSFYKTNVYRPFDWFNSEVINEIDGLWIYLNFKIGVRLKNRRIHFTKVTTLALA